MILAAEENMNNHNEKEQELLLKEIEELKRIDAKDAKDAFLKFCRKNIEREENGELDVRYASYKICQASLILPDKDMTTLGEIIDIACDLELPDEHRERPLDDWEKLKELVKGTE
jgi:hypothetical protein